MIELFTPITSLTGFGAYASVVFVAAPTVMLILIVLILDGIVVVVLLGAVMLGAIAN